MGIRRLRSTAALAATLLVTTTSAGCFAEPSPLPTIRNFLVAWQSGKYGKAAKQTNGDRAAVAAALGAVPSQLDLASLHLALGRVRQIGEDATAQFSVSIDLGDGGSPWSYGSSMRLHRTNGKWKVAWSPSIIHPALGQGQRLAIVTTTPKRQGILDDRGHTLLKPVKVEIFGVTPGRLANADQTLGRLAKITHLDKDRVIAHVRSAPPQKFLPLVTLQPDQVADAAQLRQVAGVERSSRPMYVAPAVADEIVGKLGPATAERLQQVGAPYQPGDTIGVSGLQVLEQRKLAGTPTVEVVAQDSSGSNTKSLFQVLGTESQPVTTTIDRKTQNAAENALKALHSPASLAAIDPATGNILAAANNAASQRKYGAGQNDDTPQQNSAALNGHYPPGMTFSIVTTRALLQYPNQEVTSSLTCLRGTRNIGGQTVTYSGPVERTFQANFAVGCTTAFASQYRAIAPQDLPASAARFGIGAPWSLPLPSFSGSVPAPANEAERAAEMIGRGRIEVSPLSMALLAGAVSSGTWRPPQFLKDASPSVPVRNTDSSDRIPTLQNLMLRAATYGTAKGTRVSGGVSDTVPYGNGQYVSWFVGYRQGVAFAIAVEGKAKADDLAAKFVRAQS
ncbi:penicillin-binding transpeptidase domain-containing protein [Actinoallomurus vinaceus]|uniref:Penicillin-binding transpeptidase domain-containing protein n=1 Tax=Actinoallomurus vinaceus TaxID=1080074 RepID=A0ABP8UQ95_9ACTN